jgi:hypothetical protein
MSRMGHFSLIHLLSSSPCIETDKSSSTRAVLPSLARKFIPLNPGTQRSLSSLRTTIL